MQPCPVCGTDNHPDAVFCAVCDSDLVVTTVRLCFLHSTVRNGAEPNKPGRTTSIAPHVSPSAPTPFPEATLPATVPLPQLKLVVSAGPAPQESEHSDVVVTPVVPIRTNILTSVDFLPGSPPLPARAAAPSVAAPPGAVRPRLVVVRGERVDTQYPIYDGPNYIGRTDDQPVDIDLVCQESPERVWASRQHAVIRCRRGELTLEDLNSLNGTFVNRKRISPGQPRRLNDGDVIQIGTVQLRVVV